jgi:sulfhydrogenase subunit beta (sulfur reductase)
MKIVQIDKKNWEAGLKKAAGTYRLYGPVKEGDFHNFKQLHQGQLPDLSCLNTRLSPKSIIYPQTEVMFEYSLDENQEDHHILKEANKDYSPQAVIGIRPCDARAFGLVRLNFDTPEYKDPYAMRPAVPAFAPPPAAVPIMKKNWTCYWSKTEINTKPK